MIYLNNNTKELIIPKVVSDAVSSLVLINQTSKKVYTFDIFDSTNKVNRYTINVTDDMKLIEEGQYDYQVKSGDKLLASGILQRGDYKVVTNSYNIKTDIKVYERD